MVNKKMYEQTIFGKQQKHFSMKNALKHIKYHD